MRREEANIGKESIYNDEREREREGEGGGNPRVHRMGKADWLLERVSKDSNFLFVVFVFTIPQYP